MTGAIINSNPNAAASAGAFNQGHNLHTLTTSSGMNYIIPVFPPSCFQAYEFVMTVDSICCFG
jgi:hypothetical protein